MKQAATAHQNDINPMGMAEALDENAKDDTPIIKRVYWKNEDGEVINELPDSGEATLCVITENARVGDNVKFEILLADDKKITVSGSVDSKGCAEIKNINLGLE